MNLDDEEDAVCTLGSLLNSRLVLRNAGDLVATKEVAALAQKGNLGVSYGRLRISFTGGEKELFRCLCVSVLVSFLPDDVPAPEGGNVAEWSGGPPEWLAANRGVPVWLDSVDLYLPRLFQMYAGDNEGRNGTD